MPAAPQPDYRDAMSEEFFGYRRDPRWSPLFLALGVSDRDGVTVSSERLRATFGHWSLDTTLDNVTGASITGPHRWYTAVGLRLSMADDGLTFGTNHRRGVCIEFRDRVRRVIGFRDHSSLWVSVADPDGLVAALPGDGTA